MNVSNTCLHVSLPAVLCTYKKKGYQVKRPETRVPRKQSPPNLWGHNIELSRPAVRSPVAAQFTFPCPTTSRPSQGRSSTTCYAAPNSSLFTIEQRQSCLLLIILSQNQFFLLRRRTYLRPFGLESKIISAEATDFGLGLNLFCTIRTPPSF